MSTDATPLPPAPPPLPSDLSTCHQMLRELLATVAQLRATIDKQQAHIHYLVRMTFGRRSERALGPTLFDGVVSPETEPPPPPEATKETTVVVQRGHGRRPRSADLPREREVIDLTEAEKACPCCGAQRVRIGEDVSTRLEYRPACLFHREIARPTYLCRRCEQAGQDVQAAQAPLPPEPIPRSTVGAGLLAHVIVSKWVDHLPLYRLESILARLGWEVSRSTLCDQLMACARVLTPLYEAMCRRVRASFALHADDTPIPLLEPRRTAYAWVYVGDAAHPYTVFDLSAGRQQEFPAKFLAGYRGYLHADAYAGYHPLYAAGATHVGCWMHARRNFFEAKESDASRAHEALARIRLLYAVETEAKEQKLRGADLAAYRQEHARPVLESFAEWLAAEVPRVLPKSEIGEALGYASNQWPTLVRYLEDGRLTIDNSPAEQAIRPLAIGRRNWLQIAGDGGLKSAAVLLSVTASAKRHGVNPWVYVKHILTASAARKPDADFGGQPLGKGRQLHFSHVRDLESERFVRIRSFWYVRSAILRILRGLAFAGRPRQFSLLCSTSTVQLEAAPIWPQCATGSGLG
jgi:transposase